MTLNRRHFLLPWCLPETTAMPLARLFRVCLVLASVLSATSSNVAPARAGFRSVASEESASGNSVRLIVPCPVGSPADMLARAFARTLSEGLGRTVHVVNLAPDSGNKSPGEVERALADSNTIYFIAPGADLVASCGE